MLMKTSPETLFQLEYPELYQFIQNGIDLLDEKKPGWYQKIDLECLWLADCHGCILGQLYGSYAAGLNALGLSSGWNHGFSSLFPKNFSIMGKIWVNEIMKQQLKHTHTENKTC